MLDESPFKESLRSEYDSRLFDTFERRKQAHRLSAVIHAVGIWPQHPRILDVGCGPGFKLAFLGNDARIRIGCDIRREPYLTTAKQIPDIFFVQASGVQLPFQESMFDLVTCISVIEEIPDYKKALGEMARCVAPGGVLCINVTNGIMLRPLYRIMKRLGIKISESSRSYASKSIVIVKDDPTAGFHVSGLRGWSYLHLTPAMILNRFPIIKTLPISLINWIACRFSPTFVHAWQRPYKTKRDRG